VPKYVVPAEEVAHIDHARREARQARLAALARERAAL
jgi:hypothetical protein